MSVSYVTAELRRLIVDRADSLCEYCLIAANDTYLGCQVDHIISEKHGGSTDADNLAFACVYCNRAKGSDIGSIHWQSGQFVRFFNPRTDRWNAHFALSGVRIESLSVVGDVTVRIFEMNNRERLLERQALQAVDRYPSAEALKRMRSTQ
jgi:hypothetical protein